MPYRSKFKVVDADIEQIREHYADTLKPVQVNTIGKGGKISVEDLHFSVGEFDIWSGMCRSGMEVNFTEPPDAVAIYLPISGIMEVKAQGRQLLSGPDGLVAVDLSRMNTLRIHPGRSHIGIAFSHRAIKQQLSQMIDAPVVHDLEIPLENNMDAAGSANLVALGRLLWDNLSRDPGSTSKNSTECFFRTMMTILLETVPHRYLDHLNRSRSSAMPRHVKRAIEFMAANLSQSINAEDIARAAGVSVRALQAGFQRFRDSTPLAHLRQLRLEAVRRELTTAGCDRISISDVARRYGFTHMGRFSLLYREAFGELPTKTLTHGQIGK